MSELKTTLHYCQANDMQQKILPSQLPLIIMIVI